MCLGKFFCHNTIISLFLIFVKYNYPDSFACTTKIRQHIAEVYQFEMSKDEQVYLTIHIQRLKTS
ncbi:PRD domain-containing protein [Streptococcus suis]|uniref:PRD domain-containing protein n=1 Tax=Streptococcus suis TaxID=1307 RepID=UPI0022AA09B8|nr:PRD domain-containing protein [Streptococcus suis]